MKFSVSTLAVLLFLGVLLAGCERSPKSEESKTKWIDPSKLEPGPIQYATLTDNQMQRVKFLQTAFKDVDSSPLEKWAEDFRRDTNPDPELKIWESMATAFTGFIANKELSLEAKKEVYQVVLLRSGASDEEVLKHWKIKILTEEDVKKILGLYEGKPEPIRVLKQ